MKQSMKPLSKAQIGKKYGYKMPLCFWIFGAHDKSSQEYIWNQ